MIRDAIPSDQPALMELEIATGLFQPDELEAVSAMMSEYFSGNAGEGHQWVVDDDGGIQGAAYYAPETLARGAWNLYFIGVHPSEQGKGRGGRLVRKVEATLSARGERLLLIETSGLGSFELTRTFYRKNGYTEEARIRDFYAAGDDKVIFTKHLGS